jgi:hypothetical protein
MARPRNGPRGDIFYFLFLLDRKAPLAIVYLPRTLPWPHTVPYLVLRVIFENITDDQRMLLDSRIPRSRRVRSASPGCSQMLRGSWACLSLRSRPLRVYQVPRGRHGLPRIGTFLVRLRTYFFMQPIFVGRTESPGTGLGDAPTSKSLTPQLLPDAFHFSS